MTVLSESKGLGSLQATVLDSSAFPQFLDGCRTFHDCGELSWSCVIDEKVTPPHVHLLWKASPGRIAVLRTFSVLVLSLWLVGALFIVFRHRKPLPWSRILEISLLAIVVAGFARVIFAIWYICLSTISGIVKDSELSQSFRRMKPAQCAIQSVMFDYFGADVPAKYLSTTSPCWLVSVTHDAFVEESAPRLVKDFSLDHFRMAQSGCDSFDACGSVVMGCMVSKSGDHIELTEGISLSWAIFAIAFGFIVVALSVIVVYQTAKMYPELRRTFLHARRSSSDLRSSSTLRISSTLVSSKTSTGQGTYGATAR